MKVIDISIPLSPSTLLFPGDPTVEIESVSSFDQGDAYRITRITMSAHAGTHIDTPSHIFPDGRQTEDIRLEDLVGPVFVVGFDGKQVLAASDCSRANIPLDATRVLIKNETKDAWMDQTTARWFSERGIKLLGWEGLSIDRLDSEDLPAHRTLLENGIHLVENLDLSQVDPGHYFIVCLPLKLIGSDASPVRAVLIEDFV